MRNGVFGDVAQLVRALPSNRDTQNKALISLVSSLVSILLLSFEAESMRYAHFEVPQFSSQRTSTMRTG